MTADRPLISFVTPTFNSVATVADTIASVEREAAGFAYEHLFVDGGSRDGTLEVIRNLKGSDAPITSEADDGVYDAMNKGIRQAKGEWIAFINSDDYYLPGAVAEMMKAARANPSANVLHGDMVVQFEGGKERIVTPRLGWRGRFGMSHPICHPAMWARRCVYERHGPYRTKYKVASDQDMFYRILDGRERCIYVRKPITLMRAGGLSSRYYDIGTLELLDIHSSRRSLHGLAAHLLFYRQERLRNHQQIPAGRSYWLWAAMDFLSRRLRARGLNAFSDPYLAPSCRPSTLDSFGNRRLILTALRESLPRFSGIVLDVGCGHKPYKSLLLSPPSRASRYIGLDLPANLYASPDLEWDGRKIPLEDATVDGVLLTEVLEHSPQPGEVLKEIGRVLKPGGFLFLTVPFIWPIHTVPHDEYRYTPFALRRLLDEAGFADAKIEATGGRHAVLALTLGLWVRRRALTSRVHVAAKAVLSVLLWPVIWLLLKMDRRPEQFEESAMLVGLSAAATKPV